MVQLRGARIRMCYLMLISRDGSTFAHTSSMGASLDTAFADGSILGTKTLKSDDSATPRVVMHYRPGPIVAAWEDHQRSVQAMEDQGKHAIRQGGFQVYRELSEIERASVAA